MSLHLHKCYTAVSYDHLLQELPRHFANIYPQNIVPTRVTFSNLLIVQQTEDGPCPCHLHAVFSRLRPVVILSTRAHIICFHGRQLSDCCTIFGKCSCPSQAPHEISSVRNHCIRNSVHSEKRCFENKRIRKKFKNPAAKVF